MKHSLWRVVGILGVLAGCGQPSDQRPNATPPTPSQADVIRSLSKKAMRLNGLETAAAIRKLLFWIEQSTLDPEEVLKQLDFYLQFDCRETCRIYERNSHVR